MFSVDAAFRLPFGSVSSEAPSAETSLVARVRQSDLDALGEVYDAHHVHVRRFALRLLGDDSAAEDLVQEVFVSLPSTLASFRAASSLRTFLISVAVNRARHHLRGAMRRRVLLERVAEVPQERPEDPEGHLQRRQLASLLTRALDALPEAQRIAIVLCEIEERSSAEAAAIVGVPEGTIRTRIFHGKQKLRERLRQEPPP
jgi:RNA polymerase sigma-70 factor (ECF subfamily)